MLKGKFAGLTVASLLLVGGVTHAAESTFPSAARELGDYEISTKNAKAGTPGDGKSAFPSSAIEGYEFAAEYYKPVAPPSVDRTMNDASSTAFPSSAIEFSHL